jgi:hypothetical protein
MVSRPKHGIGRPVTFRPQVEALEGRCLPSANHLGLPPRVATFSDTLQAVQTDHGSGHGPTGVADLTGTLTGGLPGAYSAHVLHTNPHHHRPAKILGGTWFLAVETVGGVLKGKFTGGRVQWDSSGKVGQLSLAFRVTGGIGPFARFTGTGSFTGTLGSGNTSAVSGTMTLTLKQPTF